jgi:hypothetical protein
MAAVSSVWVITGFHSASSDGSWVGHGGVTWMIGRSRVDRCTLKEAVFLVKGCMGGCISTFPPQFGWDSSDAYPFIGGDHRRKRLLDRTSVLPQR